MKNKVDRKFVMLLLMIIFPLSSFSQYADTELGHDGFMGLVKSAKISPYQVVIEDGQLTRGDSPNYQIRSYLNSGKLKNVTDHNADGTVARTQEYTFDQQENLLELLSRMGEMTLKRESYKYDKAGNLVETVTYTGDGSIDKKVSDQYDENNLLIETTEYSTSFGELVLNNIQKNEYDNAGNKVKEIYLGPEGENWGSAEWKYDAQGNEIEWMNMTETGEIKIRQTYLYNEENVLTTRRSFDKDGKQINEANLDHLGQPLTLIRYDTDGNISRKSGNRYDQFGNISAELRYGPAGTESVYAEYKYSYDDKNNWIQQTAYQGGEAVYIIGREISYY